MTNGVVIDTRGTIQLIFGGIALALLVWVFTVVQQTAVTVGQQSVQIAAIQVQVARIIAGMDDRYRARDAARDFKVRDDRINELEEWRKQIEGKTFER